MKILARQQTIDFYNCNIKRINDVEEIKEILLTTVGIELELHSKFIGENHASIIAAFKDGHIALHIYPELKYVAVDVFTCSEDIEPEILSKALRKFFQPDKIKSTFLKRGDFGQERDIKPKIKTRVAPLKKIRSTGARVIKTLVSNND